MSELDKLLDDFEQRKRNEVAEQAAVEAHPWEARELTADELVHWRTRMEENLSESALKNFRRHAPTQATVLRIGYSTFEPNIFKNGAWLNVARYTDRDGNSMEIHGPTFSALIDYYVERRLVESVKRLFSRSDN